jgi:outer membrane autotransporter protein
MFSGVRLECVACIKPKARACVLSAGALVVMLSSAADAQAQCNQVGLSPSSPVTQAADMVVASVSGSVGALTSSIYSANAAFLNQSSAFIGSPANPQADQEGGGVWARGVGGHLNSSTTATAGNISSRQKLD